jgi:hypothetical protein
MAKPASRMMDQVLTRVGLAVIVLIVASIVLRMILGWIFDLVRIAVLLALLGLAAWFVFIGPPGRDDD